MSGKRAVIAVLIMGMCFLGGSAAAQDENNQLTGITWPDLHQRLGHYRRQLSQPVRTLRQRAHL
jgi:hypothetical protein